MRGQPMIPICFTPSQRKRRISIQGKHSKSYIRPTINSLLKSENIIKKVKVLRKILIHGKTTHRESSNLCYISQHLIRLFSRESFNRFDRICNSSWLSKHYITSLRKWGQTYAMHQPIVKHTGLCHTEETVEPEISLRAEECREMV